MMNNTVLASIIRLSYRDLQYLIVLSRTLNFRKAAELCHVTQPTLSLQIKKLEDFLGVQLIERTNKRVIFTAIGQKIVEKALTIDTSMRDIALLARSAGNPFAGRLSLGIFPTLAPYLMPHIMPWLHTGLPDMNFELVEEKSPVLLDQLYSGKLDSAILALPVIHNGLETDVLFEEPFYLAVGYNHPLAKKKKVVFEDVETENVLLLDEGHCLRDQTVHFCQTIGVGTSAIYRGTSLETVRHTISPSSPYMTFIPALAVKQEKGERVYLPFEKEKGPLRKIVLVWRKGSSQDILLKRIKSIIYEKIIDIL